MGRAPYQGGGKENKIPQQGLPRIPKTEGAVNLSASPRGAGYVRIYVGDHKRKNAKRLIHPRVMQHKSNKRRKKGRQ